ncbi:hypothetical protein EV175_002165, partial [Coemansia sp. RSA 1933]
IACNSILGFTRNGEEARVRVTPSRAKAAASVAQAKAPANLATPSTTGQQSANTAGTASVAASTKSRSKGSAALANANIASVDGTSLAMASGAASTADTDSAPNQHHSGLQQLSRERKQQLRHQNRLQQKPAETVDLDAGTDADVEADTDQKPNSVVVSSRSRASSKGSAYNTGDLQHEKPVEATAASRSTAGEAHQPSKPEPTVVSSTANLAQTHGQAVGAQLQSVGILYSAAAGPAHAIAAGAVAQNAVAPPDYANSALSFQSITDSLFAQLNAKVSTSTSAGAGPGYASIGPFGGHGASGMRAPGYAPPGVDPLLFAPSVSSEAPSAGIHTHAGSDAPLPSFSLFSGQQMPQWNSAVGASSGAYSQSSLNSLIGESNALGAPIANGTFREPPGGGGFGQNPLRPKSRWDFAHADEASAQAELQSVLGRGFGSGADALGHQQTQPGLGVGAAALASSRDLGMFSTPVQSDYAGGPWGNLQSSQQRQQANGAMTSFAPPGFGGRHHAEGLQNDARSLAPLAPGASLMAGVGAIGNNAQGPAGPNTLLSRLIGQPPGTSSNNSSITNEALPNAMNYHQQQLSQLGFHDPSMAAAPGLTGTAPLPQQQHQQQGLGRADSNVLNSLLSRLQMGRGDGEAAMYANIAATMAPQQPQQFSAASSGALSVPPGIVPFNMATTGSLAPSSMAVGSGAPQAAGLRFQAALPYGSAGEAAPGGMVSSRSASTAPGSPLGPPPGIASPASGDGTTSGGQGQAMMVSRSANSSGRSRFLNHFSGEDPSQQRAANNRRVQEEQASNSSVPGMGSSRGSDIVQPMGEARSDSEGRMVNGVPPGLPTTGLFGELLRRAKQQGIPTGPTNVAAAKSAADAGGVNGSTRPPLSSGKVMLGDIERKLDAARREAQELQAQLTSVIGQNQSVMMAFAHGSAGSSGANNSNNNNS